MPRGADYDKKYDNVKAMLDAYEKRNDWDGMVAYMKQLYIQENLTDENVDEENTPCYDAMKCYIGDICQEIVSDPSAIEKLKAFVHANNRQSAENLYYASNKLEEIEEQIKNGEIEDTEFWAETPGKTTKLAWSILSGKTIWGKERTAIRGVGQMLDTGIFEWEKETHQRSNLINLTLANLFDSKSKDGKIVENSETYVATEKYLLNKPRMTKEKIHMLAEISASDPDFDRHGYKISQLSPDTLFDELPVQKLECRTLSDADLEAKKQEYIRNAADTENIFQKANNTQFALECGYEQEKRAMIKADPEGMKTISNRQKMIDNISKEQEKIDIFRCTIADIVTMTAGTSDFFMDDRSKRGELDREKHKDYFQVVKMAKEISELDVNSTNPQDVIKKLKDAKAATEQYKRSHTFGGLFMLKFSEEGRERVKKNTRFGLALDSCIERLEKLANDASENLTTGETLGERYNKIADMKAELREINNAEKAKIKDKVKAEMAAKQDAPEVKHEAAAVLPENKAVQNGTNPVSTGRTTLDLSKGAFEIDLGSFEVETIEPELEPESKAAQNEANRVSNGRATLELSKGSLEIDLDSVDPAMYETETNRVSNGRATLDLSKGSLVIDLDSVDPAIYETDQELQTRARSNTIRKKPETGAAPERKKKPYSIKNSQNAIRTILKGTTEVNPKIIEKIGSHIADIIAINLVKAKYQETKSPKAQKKIDSTAANVRDGQAFKNLMRKANTVKTFKKLVLDAIDKNPSELMNAFKKAHVKKKTEGTKHTFDPKSKNHTFGK